MNEKYVVAVRNNDYEWMYLGYKYDEMGYQIPALRDEESAMEFATIESARSWYEGSKKYVYNDIHNLCDPNTTCIKKRIICYEYQTIEFA